MATDAMDIDVVMEDGELTATADPNLIPTKVHIRGLNRLKTDDIEAYIHEHFDPAQFTRVQWIDDTSANLLFETEDAAMSALLAFAVDHEPSPEAEPLRLRRAKSLASHPDHELSVRMAQVTDVKEQNAASKSKFYLDNPKYDPETRRLQQRRGGRYAQNGYGRGTYQPRRDTDASIDRPVSREKAFDENLYDDDPAAVAAYRKRTRSRSPLRRSRTPPRGPRQRSYVDLISSDNHHHDRLRSASPEREWDGNGHYGFSDDQPQRRTARQRTPPAPIRPASTRDNYAARDRVRELFPSKTRPKSGVSSSAGSNTHAAIELFPHKAVQSSQKTFDLFPEKLARRESHSSRARAYSPEEVTTAMRRYQLDGARDREDEYERYDDRTEQEFSFKGRRETNGRRRSTRPNGDLFAGTKLDQSVGRLNSDADGFSIKGAGAGRLGFGFKGAAG